MPTVTQLKQRARYIIGEPVVWRGVVYRIAARYWRKRNDSIHYDLREANPASGAYPTEVQKIPEQDLSEFARSVRPLG
jgi:hypothetical protein